MPLSVSSWCSRAATRTTLLLGVVVVSALAACVRSQSEALRCTDHPAYHASLAPPLLRSIQHLPVEFPFERVLYYPRHTAHNYLPVEGVAGAPSPLQDLDLFFTGRHANPPPDVARLYLQRPAMAYLFVGVGGGDFRAYGGVARAALKGWESVGWAQLEAGAQLDMEFGIFEKGVVLHHQYVYVFSKSSGPGDVVMVPSEDWIKRNLRAPFEPLVNSKIRLAERDGTPPPPPGEFQGTLVLPNTKCPDALHRAWAVSGKDRGDPDTLQRLFGSWHPLFDPCYFCSYGHEHGSSPRHLMGYAPTFDYTAFKNGREAESDEGFKGFVFRMRGYMVYYGIHGQTSSLRRVKEDYHTIAVVITDAETQEVMVELQQKADFGFLAGRGRNSLNEMVPLTREGQERQADQMARDVPRKFRTINVINVNKPDPRFRYRDVLTQGVYEVWSTLPMCATAPPFGEIRVDFQSPTTGILSTARTNERVELGTSSRNTGLSRTLRLKDVEFSAANCKFENTDEQVSGTFYTDPRGTTLKDGPGPGAVRQYVRDGFKLSVSGAYELVEQALGIHGQVSKPVQKAFGSHTYGVDPDIN